MSRYYNSSEKKDANGKLLSFGDKVIFQKAYNRSGVREGQIIAFTRKNVTVMYKIGRGDSSWYTTKSVNPGYLISI